MIVVMAIRCFVLLLCLAGVRVVEAQEVRPAYLPLTFHAEASPIRTSACLQVVEQTYPSDWWEGTARVDRAGQAFKSVIAAMKAGNRPALLNATDRSQAKDVAAFDKQANAFFLQLKALTIVAVPKAYAFDGLVVFFAQLKGGTQNGYAPFVFAESGDMLGFLPLRSTLITYTLVSDWFNAPWGPASSPTPGYCSDAEIRRATHRVGLAGTRGTLSHPSALLLAGGSLDAPGSLAASAERVKSIDAAMKAAVVKDLDAFAAFLTPEGAGQLKQWANKATETERTNYRDAVLGQRPFFVFDASPLLVTYTRTTGGSVQVMYFLSVSTELRWANASHVTTADDLFKRGSLYEASSLDLPFNSLRLTVPR